MEAGKRVDQESGGWTLRRYVWDLRDRGRSRLQIAWLWALEFSVASELIN